MKKTSITFTTTALALILAAPTFALAKEAPHKGMHPFHPPAKFKPSVSKGDIDTVQNGEGTYKTIAYGPSTDRTSVTIDKFSNGVTLVTKTTDDITKNANGSTTYDVTSSQYDTKTKTRVTSASDETYTSTGAGDYTITGSERLASGQNVEVSGTKDTTSYGTDLDLTLTNSADQKQTTNTEDLIVNGAKAAVVTGTNFNGQAINNAVLYVSNPAPALHVIDTTGDGIGYYSNGSSTTNGVTTSEGTRTFADGASSTSSTTKTVDSSTTSTIDGTSSSITSKGALSTGSSTETLTNNGGGDTSYNGTFTQSNGYYGTYAGSTDKTDYGYSSSATYTDPNGPTKSTATKELVIGNVALNDNTGTSFTGQNADSATLFTGQ